MGKNKRAWVHIDTVKGENSEFDSLGAVEELKDYNEEELSTIIAETTGFPPKKKKKLKTVEEITDSDRVNLANKSNSNKSETGSKKKEKKKIKKKKLGDVISISDSQKEGDVKGENDNDTDKKKKKKKKSKKETKKKNSTVDSKTKDNSNDNSVKNIEKKTNEVITAKSQKKKKKADVKTSEDTGAVISKSSKDGTKEQTNEVEIDLLDIKDKWGNMGIPDEILKALLDKRFTEPTDIQKGCIPKGIGFKDVVGAAETGSGKTLAFGIPVIANTLNMIKKRIERNKKGVSTDLYGVVIAPTRELALQIEKHLKEMTKYCDVTLCAVVGGLAPEKQERLLGRCPNVVIATPGRLMKMLTSGNEHLQKISNIRFLVIDECDRMFEKGHFRELKTILEQMKLKGGRKVQKFVFSATLSVKQSPKKQFYDDLCSSIALDPKARVVDLTTKRITVEQLTQMKVLCETDEKEIYLFHFLLTYPGRTIVFANTIACIDRLSRLLRVLELNPLQLHAKKQQKQRLQRLDDFRASKQGLLVCTDVAAHGLDIPEVDNVVHFQLPKDAKVYIHRSGRTARANKNGRTLIINGPEDFESFNNISKLLLKDKDNEMETLRVESFLLKSLKERITLAKEIERQMFQQKRVSSDASWKKRVSKEMDIDGTGGADVSKTEGDGNSEQRKFLQGKQKQLKRLLKTNPVANQTKDKMFSKSRTITIANIALT